MTKLTRDQALEMLAADRAAGVIRTQRDYRDIWGCSVSTVHSWCRTAEQGAEQGPKKSRTRCRTSTEQSAEQAPNTSRTRCRTCSEQTEQISEILALTRLLASSISLLLKEKNPPSLRSGGSAAAEHEPNTEHRTRAEQPNTEQAEHAPNKIIRTMTEQGTLIPLPPRDRLAPPGPNSPLLNFLKGSAPPRLDGTRASTPTEWLDENWPLIAATVEAEDQDLDDKQFYAKAKVVMLRWWNNRKPVKAAPTSSARGVFDWENASDEVKNRGVRS